MGSTQFSHRQEIERTEREEEIPRLTSESEGSDAKHGFGGLFKLFVLPVPMRRQRFTVTCDELVA